MSADGEEWNRALRDVVEQALQESKSVNDIPVATDISIIGSEPGQYNAQYLSVIDLERPNKHNSKVVIDDRFLLAPDIRTGEVETSLESLYTQGIIGGIYTAKKEL